MSSVRSSPFFAIASTLLLAGCVVRTQEFHCVMENNPTQTFEMSMSPTSLVYQGSRLGFDEEKGAQRFYSAPDGRFMVSFNSASGELIARMGDRSVRWSCKRYEILS